MRCWADEISQADAARALGIKLLLDMRTFGALLCAVEQKLMSAKGTT
jgi:hypothetical protein